MWANPRLLNAAAGFVVGLAVLGLSLGAFQLLIRSPLLPLREIVIAGEVHRTERKQIEAAVRGRIGGNFFAADIAAVRSGIEQLPWVRRAWVRRVWPDRLEVTLEEHVAIARWGDDALINTYGERFAARSDAALPVFVAPAGTESEVARRYAIFSQALAPLGTDVQRVVLTPRLAWQLRLGNGLHLMLGRDADAAQERLRRFVAVYRPALERTLRPHEYIDLRYPNGFALRVPQLKG